MLGASAGQAPLSLGGTVAGLTDQHDLAVQAFGELPGVLLDEFSDTFDRAGDAGGLELSGVADVQDGDPVGLVQPRATVVVSTLSVAAVVIALPCR